MYLNKLYLQNCANRHIMQIMRNYIDIYRTPGQLLSALLQEKNWSGRMLAAILDVDETSVNRLIQDRKSFTAPLAISLEETFGSELVQAADFLLLQCHFELATARLKNIPDPERQARLKLYGDFPVNEMIKRGWINVENRKDFSKIESEIIKFFNVDSLDEVTEIPHSAKKTNQGFQATQSQISWINRVKQIAHDSLVKPYSPDQVSNLIHELKSLLISADAIRKVPKILADYGIRFVIVEGLKDTKIDGVCLWLDKSKPVIGMSLRFDRIDNFWFVLRHELEHVFMGDGQEYPIIDTELDGSNLEVNDQEKHANQEAAEFCLPTKKMDSFILRKSPFFSEQDIIGFAKTMKIHPGLVAGQLRHRTKKYTHFGKHLVPIRSTIIPSASVDGWGDIYPLD